MRALAILALVALLIGPALAGSADDDLLRRFSDPNSRRFGPAYRALEARGVEALPILVQALTDPHENVRLGAAKLIGRLGTEGASAAPLLTLALDDPKVIVAQHAAEALIRLSPLPPELLDRVADSAERGRRLRSAPGHALRVLLLQGKAGAPRPRRFLPAAERTLATEIGKNPGAATASPPTAPRRRVLVRALIRCPPRRRDGRDLASLRPPPARGTPGRRGRRPAHRDHCPPPLLGRCGRHPGAG